MKKTNQKKRKGILFVISGPSGVGKGTVARELKKENSDINYSVSVTTRKPRPAEMDGKDYLFVSKQVFCEMMKNNEFMESAKVHNNYYGTPRKQVEKSLKQGKNIILEIDIQGAKQIKGQYPESVLIFLTPPSIEELKHRLQKRNSESATIRKLRLKNAREELENRKFYDYQVVNADLEDTIREIKKIIKNETRKAGLK